MIYTQKKTWVIMKNAKVLHFKTTRCQRTKMERKIGKTFPVICKGKLITVEVVVEETCKGCAFEYSRCTNDPDILKETGYCCSVARKDMRSVIFKEVKGETSN
jgi:hypothetical protein